MERVRGKIRGLHPYPRLVAPVRVRLTSSQRHGTPRVLFLGPDVLPGSTTTSGEGPEQESDEKPRQVPPRVRLLQRGRV